MILLLIVVASLCQQQTLYQLLEIDEYASEMDIKKAFRKLSAKYHPDRKPGDAQNQQKFLQINRAHDILSDVSKRITYDLFGEQGLSDYQKGKKKPKGGDYRPSMQITLEDCYIGTQRTFSFNRGQICKRCKGTGDSSGKLGMCPFCSGKGTIQKQVNMGGQIMSMPVKCHHCEGTGKGGHGNCEVCGGKKIKMQPRDLIVEVEKGMKDGDIVVFRGESQQTIQTYPGDVYLTLKVPTNRKFQRIGNHLYSTLNITLREAILGFDKKIIHLDNHEVEISTGQISQNGRIIEVQREGMPIRNDPSNYGNLYVKIEIQFPKSFTDQQIRQIQELYVQEEQN